MEEKKKPNKNQFLLLCWDIETSKANSPLPWHCLESALEPGTQLLGLLKLRRAVSWQGQGLSRTRTASSGEKGGIQSALESWQEEPEVDE